MKSPNVYKLSDLLRTVNQTQACINDKWVPARSLGFASLTYRFRCAWLVFTGQADALIWPEGQ